MRKKVKSKWYLSGSEWVDGKISAYYFGDGRITFADSKSAFEYTLKDHLGSTVVTFTDKDGNHIISPEAGDEEVLHRTHYYPFGMTMDVPTFEDINDPDQDYQYNGKEFNGDLDLDWSDYGARWYNARIGRWSGVDPLAEKYLSIAPYAYVANNPISLIDPDGRYIIPAAFAQKYKMITRYLRNNIQKDVMGSERILNAFKIESQGNLTREKVMEAVTDGQGPTIMYREDKIGGSIDAEGVYEPSSNEIQLRGETLDKLEEVLQSGVSEEEKQKALLSLFMTVTHETVHYGDYLDGKKYYSGEEHGENFEQRVWLGSTYIDSETGKEHLIFGIFNDEKEQNQHAYENNPDALPTVPEKNE